MRRIARLQCLNGRYRFRAGVPLDLRAYFGGRREVVFSLRTADYDEAWLRVMRVSVAFDVVPALGALCWRFDGWRALLPSWS